MMSMVYAETVETGMIDTMMLVETVAPIVTVLVFALIAGWIATTWLRLRHKERERREDRAARSGAEQRNASLEQQNGELREQFALVKDRLSVLERIVTDRGYDVATQIEALRETRDAQSNPVTDRKEPA